MKKIILAWALLGLASFSLAVSPHRIYTQPDIPPTEALDRLNLKMLWRTFIPMDGRKDGFHHIQVLDSQILIQTQSGMLILVHGETGEILWKKLLGRPYQVIHAPSYNKNFVFAINENDIHCLDRKTGNQIFQTSLGIGLSAPPSADNVHVYLTGANKRIYAYSLPMFNEKGEFLGYEKTTNISGKTRAVIKKEEEQTEKIPTLNAGTVSALAGKGIRTQGHQPLLQWEYQTRLKLNYPLMVTQENVAAVGYHGDLATLSIHSELPGTTTLANTYEVGKEVLAPPVAYQDIAYIGSLDSSVHAFDLKAGVLLWRFTVGSPVLQTPFISGEELFVAGERNGLAKVSLKDGSALWSIPSGARFSNTQEKAARIISANPKFVYALDRSGRMVILDRGLGIALTTWDVHDYVFPVVNRVNDRIHLAANNGLLICMRDRDYPKPVPHLIEETEPGDAGIPMGGPGEKLLMQLTAKVEEKDSGDKTLAEIMDYLGKKYMVKFNLNAKALLAAMIIDVEKKPAKIPDTKDKTLGELLNAILDPLDLTFQPVQDTILIFPKKKEAGQG
ncbi:MAG: hypothetical protein EXR99_00705 [Gemmataceae bacterium]|nr:hypothetical protein [Gemmataceae bacterium]